jgi:hypothetical protein
VPLVQHLSNDQFMTQLDRICKIDSGAPANRIPMIDHQPRCACGCGQAVTPGRKFASQAHYDHAKGLSQADAERLVADFRRGVPKRQLARDFGVALTTVKRLLRKEGASGS